MDEPGRTTPASSERIEKMSGGAIDKGLERTMAMHPPGMPAAAAQHRGEVPGDAVETIQAALNDILAQGCHQNVLGHETKLSPSDWIRNDTRARLMPHPRVTGLPLTKSPVTYFVTISMLGMQRWHTSSPPKH